MRGEKNSTVIAGYKWKWQTDKLAGGLAGKQTDRQTSEESDLPLK